MPNKVEATFLDIFHRFRAADRKMLKMSLASEQTIFYFITK